MTKTLQNFFDKYLSKLYAISYCLAPDTKEAMRLMKDALTVFQIKEEKFLNDQEFSLQGSYVETFAVERKILRKMIKQILKCAQGRTLDSRRNISLVEHQEAFYHLSLKQRLVLFLKVKINMDFKELEEIFEVPKSELMRDLYLAKNFLLKNESFDQEIIEHYPHA